MGCDGVTDVSSLGNIRTLSLTKGGVRALHVLRCERVSDVGTLGKVHEFLWSGNDLVTDVSMLGNVYSLALSDCTV